MKAGLRTSFHEHYIKGLGPVVFATDVDETDAFVEALRIGYSVEPEVIYALETLGPGEEFIDVGANIGRFTIPISKLGIRTLAIEALPKNFTLLVQALERNGIRSAAPVHCAASDVSGIAYVSGSSAWGTVGNVGIAVPTATVDQLAAVYDFERVCLVKIDVEGSEMSVLRGMSRLLELADIEIIIECNGHKCAQNGYTESDLLAKLEERGFHCYLVSGFTLAPRTAGDFQERCVSNFLATRKALSGRIGSFEIRDLSLQERVELVQSDFMEGPIHRGYLVRALERAPRELLAHPQIKEIVNRLAEDSEASPPGIQALRHEDGVCARNQGLLSQ